MEDKKRSKTNRIKRNVFGNEDDYINLERELYNTRTSRDRSVRAVRKSNPRETSEPPCSPLTQRAAGITSRQSSGSEGHKQISPIITNQEEDCDLEKGEENVELSEGEKTEFGEFRETESGKMEYVDWKESEMVGEGDFRGMHQRDPNSRYNALLRRIKKQNRDPTLKGKFLNKSRGKHYKFCCDTGSSCNLIPVRMAALNGLEYSPLDDNEPNYSSVTNHRLNILGQTTCFIRLEKISKPIKISFLVCGDDGDEALLSLDTLVELSIVPPDFPCPMNAAIRDHKISRINEVEEVEEVDKEEKTKWGTIKERVDSLRSQLSFPQENRKEDMEEEKCEALKQAWMKDFSQVFKEDLTIEDRIKMEPVKIKLVENHKDIPVYHPKAANEIPAYLRAAADKELNRMIAGGLLEKVEEYSETVSRGFFVP